MAAKDSSSTKSETNTDKPVLTCATVAQLQVAMNEIANLAWVAQTLVSDAGQSGSDDSTVALIHAGGVLMQKIGFIADLCSVKLGGTMSTGGAEEWFMPPQYHDVEKAVEAA